VVHAKRYMANDREHGKEGEAREYHSLAMPMMHSGLNREREMSVMISALIHVLRGEEHGHDHSLLHPSIDNTAIGGGDGFVITSSTPSSASSSYCGNSVFKRRREGGSTTDLPRGTSLPTVSTRKHQTEYIVHVIE